MDLHYTYFVARFVSIISKYLLAINTIKNMYSNVSFPTLFEELGWAICNWVQQTITSTLPTNTTNSKVVQCTMSDWVLTQLNDINEFQSHHITLLIPNYVDPFFLHGYPRQASIFWVQNFWVRSAYLSPIHMETIYYSCCNIFWLFLCVWAYYNDVMDNVGNLQHSQMLLNASFMANSIYVVNFYRLF